jgi:hypothetical protein
MFVCVVILLTIKVSSVYAIKEINSVEFLPKNIEKSTNGASVNLSQTDINKWTVDVNTKGLSNGYYSTYLYDNEVRDWSNYSAIAFDLKNHSDDKLKLNLNIKTNDNRILSIPDGNTILIKEDSENLLESLQVNYGAIEIDGKFSGTIYLSFATLKENPENVSKDIQEVSKISSWGILTVNKENEEVNFDISKMSLISNEAYINKYFENNLFIEGDDLIDIPSTGEKVYNYKVRDINSDESDIKEMKFTVKDEVDGVKIDEDGKLTLTADTKLGQIEVWATSDGVLGKKKKIQLINSLITDGNDSNTIPKATEVPKIMDNSFLMNKNILSIMRLAMIIIISGFLVLYWYWEGEYKSKH